jgi:hypothetical protein
VLKGGGHVTKPIVKKWVFSPHAATRMMERGVSVDAVQQLIETPDLVVAQGPKWVFAKSFSARHDNLIAAVLLERKDKDLWIVLTVMINFQAK